MDYKEVYNQWIENPYFDEATNEVKGKCKLKAHKNYFAFEIRQGKDDDYILVGGSPVFKK